MLYSDGMARRIPANFRIDPEQLAGLQAVKARDGIPQSEQVRRALNAWLESRGVKAERKRATTRKRS